MATAHARLYATANPVLRLNMAVPHPTPSSMPYPFGDPLLQYYYLARNGIYALANHFDLPDREVLFPAYFHGVELETLQAAGVKLKFYPVHSGMRVDVDEIRSLVSPRTRAIYMIHYLGFPGPVEEVTELCRQRNLLLIEDCALALLSCLGDKPLGSFGDMAVFCLYKSIPVPNGGAAVVRNPYGRLPAPAAPSVFSTMAYTATALARTLRYDSRFTYTVYEQARKLGKSMSRNLGVVQVGSDHFDPSQVGLAMSRSCHWIIAAQNYSSIVETRRRNFMQLLDRLRLVSPPVFSELPQGVCPLFYPLRVRNKVRVMRKLLERGIESVNFWSHTESTLPEGAFPEVDEMRRTVLEIPCHQDLTSDSIDWIAQEVCALRADL
jgi:perosamine synthetase